MAGHALPEPEDPAPIDRSLRLQIEEARIAALYIKRASTWAADIDHDIAVELMALHRRMLQRIQTLDRFEP
ncbi:MAG TPA: hypothetical protein VKF59_00385 [Candidatus Dormibacteraeota bacterium]|nr:hypothetical protein [Candidatus Dormibacteraeota bacterium]